MVAGKKIEEGKAERERERGNEKQGERRQEWKERRGKIKANRSIIVCVFYTNKYIT